MEFNTVVMIVVLCTVGFLIVFMVLWIAGKDILLAFMRRLNPHGCDVFIATNTRNISHFYKTPRDGKFLVRGFTYITNPEKLMNLEEEEKLLVIDNLMQKDERYNQRINEIKKRIAILTLQYTASQDQGQKFQLYANIQQLEGVIANFESKKRKKQENYFKTKRPAFFYMEGDSIPKDFYEYYSTVDAKIIDNMLVRAKTEPLNKKVESDLDRLKLIVIGLAIACIVAAYFSYKNNSMLVELCKLGGCKL